MHSEHGHGAFLLTLGPKGMKKRKISLKLGVAHGRLKQEDCCEFEASLGYIVNSGAVE